MITDSPRGLSHILESRVGACGSPLGHQRIVLHGKPCDVSTGGCAIVRSTKSRNQMLLSESQNFLKNV